ncbi:cupin [Maritimibacter sp. 55A14]|uniref:cupin domain-containing protein n=1 Tax=Maritimibacter sp. 55A14 TaxID=2174844 RepID=UPI000D60B997|nr:cupin [Maritimibacter sp. 55A14]PWE33382.1 cupin [Maritimibacter sp. 55A14]
MQIVRNPTRLRAAGDVEKSIFEYVGRMSGATGLSVARMESPTGWSEPGQRPDFREITIVISGALHVETETDVEVLGAGEAMICEAGEWVRYSTPDTPTEYVAICTPAFAPHLVHRDAETVTTAARVGL